ncbi:MAG: transglycosylase SLT domain-containing protein [Acidimicrobiia bacterium]|nr:transglycosylase SLT domain-containing protein [Acidimicrobiia bacterium]
MSAAAITSITDRIEQLTGRFEPPATAAGQRSSVDAGFADELARLTAGQKAAYSANTVAGAAVAGLYGTSATIGMASLGAPAGVIGSAAPSPAANTVISAAKEELGVPYLWGGTTSAGWDCSGLVQHAYREAGVSLPRVSRDQARMGVEVPSIDQALPGDLVAFGQPTVDHIGIYLGNGQMLHAPRRGDVVKIGPIQRKIATIRRVLTPGSPAATSLAAPTPLNPPSGATAAAAPARFRALFEQAGSAHGVDPGLLAAVAKNESAFNPNAVSPAGAQGIMQFMPGTAAQFGVDPFDPASAIDGAARFLRQLQDQFGSVELALAAYNAGPGNVTKYGGIPPFTETRNYVTNVMDTWRSGS